MRFFKSRVLNIELKISKRCLTSLPVLIANESSIIKTGDVVKGDRELKL